MQKFREKTGDRQNVYLQSRTDAETSCLSPDFYRHQIFVTCHQIFIQFPIGLDGDGYFPFFKSSPDSVKICFAAR